MVDSKLVTDPLDPIRAILIKYGEHQIGPAGADSQIMAILFRRGFASKRKRHPMKVGIHRLNRGGVIGASMEVELLMDEIAELFWNNEAAAHALCVEIAPGDTSDENAFREWCEAAEVDLPPVLPNSLEGSSLACGHTNCGLRAIDSKCESANPKLGDGSNYDVEVIRKRDQPFAEAVEEGLLWTVVRAVVLRMYPELVDLWIVSRNTFGHVQRPGTEVTALAKLHASWA